MNREILLATVKQELREQHAVMGKERPLGEIVLVVSAALDADQIGATSDRVDVVSIEKVAAFVDGGLDADENEMVFQSAVHDNSVLAEIIAAVRADQGSGESKELTPDLMTRLLAMQIPQHESAEKWSEQRRDPIPTVHQETLVELPRVDDIRSESERRHARRPAKTYVVGAAVLVASVVLAFFALRGDVRDPTPRQRRDVADQSRLEQTEALAGTETPSRQSDAEAVTSESTLDVNPTIMTNERSSVAAVQTESDLEIEGDPSALDRAMGDSLRDEPSMTESSKGMAAAKDRPNFESLVRPPTASVAGIRGGESSAEASSSSSDGSMEATLPRVADDAETTDPPLLRWTEVSGILSDLTALASESSSQSSPVWHSVRVGDSPRQGLKERGTTLRTLPYSRAKGEFGRGALVLSGDTGVRWRGHSQRLNPLEIDLLFGALALVDLQEGTKVHLYSGDTSVAVLRSGKQASVVVHREVGGYQIQVSGDVEINESPVHDSIVSLPAQGDVGQQSKLKRLPRWVTRPEESGAKERMILAQIGEAEDFVPLLDKQITLLSSASRLTEDEGRALTKLAAWRAAIAGPALYRFISSRNPVLRQAAFQRLGKMSKSDPRYRPTWRAIDSALNDPPRSAQVRVWLRMRQQGMRPNQVQMEQMIQGLGVRDVGHRAMSDWLLRQFIPNAPPYDPTWTGPALQRGLMVYRERAGLPKNRTRPSGASRK